MKDDQNNEQPPSNPAASQQPTKSPSEKRYQPKIILDRCDECDPSFNCWNNGNKCRKQPAEAVSEAALREAKARLAHELSEVTVEREHEAGRWYDAINAFCHAISPKAAIDGSGADSGDLLDSATAELHQAHNYWQDRAYDALCEMGLSDTIGKDESALETVISIFSDDNIEEASPTRADLTAELATTRERLVKCEADLAEERRQFEAFQSFASTVVSSTGTTNPAFLPPP